MKVKRLVAAFLLLSFLLNLCGCQTNTSKFNPYTEDELFEFDHQKLNTSSNGFQMGIAESQDGYYFVANDCYLFFSDKETLDPVIVCNKPNCRHNLETDPEKKAECNAYVEDGIPNLMYYDHHLYYIATVRPEPRKVVYYLRKLALDGTFIEDVYQFPAWPAALIMHRGYIYYSYGDYDAQEMGGVYTTFRLARASLTDKKEQVLHTNEYLSPYISSITAAGKYVYFESTGYTVTGDQFDPTTGDGMIFKYYCFNTQTESITEMEGKEGATPSQPAITKDSLIRYFWYFNYEDERNRVLYRSDLEGQGLEEVFKVDPTVYSILWDGTYFYVDNNQMITNARKEDVTRTIQVYTPDFELLTSFDFTDVDGEDLSKTMNSTLKISDDYLFTVDRASDFQAASFYYIDKSEIASGKVSPHKVTF